MHSCPKIICEFFFPCMCHYHNIKYHTVKTLSVKNFAEFGGELQQFAKFFPMQMNFLQSLFTKVFYLQNFYYTVADFYVGAYIVSHYVGTYGTLLRSCQG